MSKIFGESPLWKGEEIDIDKPIDWVEIIKAVRERFEKPRKPFKLELTPDEYKRWLELKVIP